jgi:uncharacterized protein (TIGR02246 family)
MVRSAHLSHRVRMSAARSPEEIHALIEAAFNAQDLEAFTALHEPDATALVPPDGTRVRGREAITAAVGPMIARGPRARIEFVAKLEGDRLALTYARWQLAFGGEAMSGRGTIVSRRQPDGRWLIVLDNPQSPG